MSSKTALITGITGQDGAYLAELLLAKGYAVHGIKRRASLFNTDRIDHLYLDPHEQNFDLTLHYGDLTDSSALVRIVAEVQPDEIYNLAAQSHVAVSFEEPEYTANSDALGALRMLEAIRIVKREKTTRFYQASTSELYGLVQEIPQKETTPSIRDRPMQSQNCMPTGPRSITARPTGSMPATASCSITSPLCAAKRSSRARSRAHSRASTWVTRSGCISAISTPSATGDTPATTSKCSG